MIGTNLFLYGNDNKQSNFFPNRISEECYFLSCDVLIYGIPPWMSDAKPAGRENSLSAGLVITKKQIPRTYAGSYINWIQSGL